MTSHGAKPEKTAAGAGPNQLTEAFGRQLSMASRSIHADDYTNTHTAVAPPMRKSNACCQLLFSGFFGSRACSRDSALTPEWTLDTPD